MRALRLIEPGRLELASIREPEPGNGEALVAIDVCGVCGSDLHLVDGTTRATYPVVIGHEAAGTVVERGPGADGPAPGSRVAVLPYVGCGRCPLCRAGQPQACPARQVLGVDRDGAHADLVAVPAECLVALPDAVPSDIGAILTDAVATPYHAIGLSGVARGDVAVVFGLGGLGMHAVALLAEIVGATVIAIDPRESARRRAIERGARRALDVVGVTRHEVTEGISDCGADVAFEFVGDPTVVSAALRVLRPRGTCVVVGISPDRLRLELRQETIVGREIRLLGSFGCTSYELQEVVRLAAEGRVDLTRSVTHSYRPDEFSDALAETRDKSSGSLRVAIRYR